MATLIPIPEGGRSQWTAVITGVVNLAIVAAEALGFSLPDGVWTAINTVLGTLFSIFLADKLDVTRDTAHRIEAKQPAETPVVVVKAPPAAEVKASGADVLHTTP